MGVINPYMACHFTHNHKTGAIQHETIEKNLGFNQRFCTDQRYQRLCR
jgi:hypothetical protein